MLSLLERTLYKPHPYGLTVAVEKTVASLRNHLPLEITWSSYFAWKIIYFWNLLTSVMYIFVLIVYKVLLGHMPFNWHIQAHFISEFYSFFLSFFSGYFLHDHQNLPVFCSIMFFPLSVQFISFHLSSFLNFVLLALIVFLIVLIVLFTLLLCPSFRIIFLTIFSLSSTRWWPPPFFLYGYRIF